MTKKKYTKINLLYQKVSAEDAGIDYEAVELEDLLTFSQVVHESDDIDDEEKEDLIKSKKNRTAFNNFCKRTEGMKYSPLLKSNGRMKAAHKASTGRKAVKNIISKSVR